MRADGNNRNKLPDLFVSDIIEVLQTSSVQLFTDKMKQFHNNIDFRRFEGSIKSFNTPAVLEDVCAYVNRVYTEMFNVGAWQNAILSKPKSSFKSAAGNIFWKNRYWNCEEEGCNKYRCPKPADKARSDKNELTWKIENNKGKNNSNDRRKKTTPHEWRPPTSDKNNKRVIHNKPCTWNGKNSWIKYGTPDSGFESPDVSPSATDIAITGQKNAAAAIAAAA